MTKTKKQKAPFRGTQQNLYSICTLAWGYCLQYLSAFVKESPRFTTQYVEDMLKKVDTAQKMDAQKTRNNAYKTARTTLLANKIAAANLWQLLKGYIESAFPTADIPSKLTAAGQKEYNESGTAPLKFDLFKDMLKLANTFITDNQAILLEKENMPTDFPERFTTATSAFNTSLSDYILKQQAAEQGTEDKAVADEEIYADLTPMLDLGKKIYRSDPVKVKLFTYDELLKSVRGNSPSGFKGTLTIGTSKKPATNVTIAIPDLDLSTMTDAKGKFKLEVASGKYDVVISGPDYEPVELTGKVVKVGTMHRLSIGLTPVVEEMVVEPVVAVVANNEVAPGKG